MATTVTFPNGQQLVSSALSALAIQQLFQQITAAMLGINIGPVSFPATLSVGLQLAVLQAPNPTLYPGMTVTGPGIQTFTDGVSSVIIDSIIGTEMMLSSGAAANGLMLLNFADLSGYSKVRITWQPLGQPGFNINDDICFIDAVLEENPNVDLITEQVFSGTTQTTYYTRVWLVHFTLYGPSAFNNARQLKSASLLQFSYDFLATNNVYLVPDTNAPKRLPEQKDNQWWERTDLFMRFNEFVTETITVGIGNSAEVVVQNKSGVLLDFTV